MDSAFLRRAGRAALGAVAAGALLVVLGCGGSSSGGSGNGSLQVMLADAPGQGVTNLVVTFSKVEANVGDIWTPLTLAASSFDLVALAKNATPLAATPADSLPAGQYSQIRLLITDAKVSFDNGATYQPVTVPSGAQTGLKILVNYDIQPKAVTHVLLDFNVGKSLVKQGNGTYRLQPVIAATVQVLSGTISGRVVDAKGPVVGATVTATPTDAALSSNGAVTQSDGTYKIWALMPGSYNVSAVLTDGATPPVTLESGDATANPYAVTANNDTPTGDITIK